MSEVITCAPTYFGIQGHKGEVREREPSLDTDPLCLHVEDEVQQTGVESASPSRVDKAYSLFMLAYRATAGNKGE